MPDRRASITAMLGGGLLAACGFQLRGTTELPFSRIALEGFAARSPLADELRRTLSQSAEIVATPAQAQVVLHALTDRRERSVVASTTAGQVRELALQHRGAAHHCDTEGLGRFQRCVLFPSNLMITQRQRLRHA